MPAMHVILEGDAAWPDVAQLADSAADLAQEFPVEAVLALLGEPE